MRRSIIVINAENSPRGGPCLPRLVDEAYRWYRQGRPVVVVPPAPPTPESVPAAAAPLEDLLERCGIPASTIRSGGGPCDAEALQALDSTPVAVVYGLHTRHAAELGANLSRHCGAAFAQINLTERTPCAGPKLRVGLLGIGTVGRGVYEALRLYPEQFVITGIAARDLDHPERTQFRRLLCGDPWEIVPGDADVIVELIGGEEPARALIAEALRRGKHVVTANKLVMARHGAELSELAGRHGGSLQFAAAVGGAVPMLETVYRLRFASPVKSLQGVLNGTCNFVLDELARGRAFPEAVARARTLGFAEADPTLDLDGTDSAHKLTLLARACGAKLSLENVDRSGIVGIDARRISTLAANGKAVRLVASFSHGKARVAPRVLDAEHPLARICGEQNCLIARHAGGSRQVLSGKGAGRWPTTVSVMGDVLALAAAAKTGALEARAAWNGLASCGGAA